MVQEESARRVLRPGCVRLKHTVMSVWLEAEEDLSRRQQDLTSAPFIVIDCGSHGECVGAR